jgi:glycosyltransferase involved in cell wall biosynthesis
VVHIGNLAARGDRAFAVLKNYAAFYRDLASSHGPIVVFARSIGPDSAAYEFLNEEPLDPAIAIETVPGNTAHSSLRDFVLNNLRAFTSLARFTFRRGDYFIFLPSMPGAAALLCLLVTRRQSSLGLYIGGDFAAEQKHERRSVVKQLTKAVGAPLITRIIDRGIRRADYVVTTSPRFHHEYRDVANIAMAPPLLNVTPEDLESPIPPVGTDPLRLVYCGELRVAKGVMVLLEALRALRDQHPELPFVLRVIGSGDAEAEMKRFVAQHRLEDRVELVGQVKDRKVLVSLLREAFALVLPSFSEGFPRVAYESFTVGIPTLLTPVGGIPYLVRDGEHTLYVAPGSADDIVRAALRLASEPGLRDRLIDNGRALMRERIFPLIAMHGSLARMVAASLRGGA